MDVLADFLKTAGITASVDPTPYVVQDWKPASVVPARSTGQAQVKMVCVAAGEYSIAGERTRKPLTTGDVLFLLDGSSCHLEGLRSSSTLIVGSIVFRAGIMALATLNLPSATIVRGWTILNPRSWHFGWPQR